MTRAGAQSVPTVTPRINAPVDDAIRTTLAGNTHPLARPEFDRGAVADSQPMRRMLLRLRRSDGQEAALRALLDQQQNQSSPNYHRWLTPQEFGQQFGPADSDIQAVSGWLESHGFQIARVSAGKNLIEFSGNARQVREAFRTEIHRYVVNGQEHFANATNPQIPTALAPIVAGTVSLHNFPRKAQGRVAGAFSRDKSTGVVKPLKGPEELRNGNTASANFTFSSPLCPLNNTCLALGPADFDTIYNVPSGFNGTGQTIAIVGDSEICTASSPDFASTCNSDDVANFRNLFNLPPNLPKVIVDEPDPGFNFDETEGDLDVGWAGAIAKNATIDFVIAQGTETNSGMDLAAEYVVDNNLAPVLSESFGECEEFLGTINIFYYDLWEQAAAQGITVVVAAGDSGSAGCDFPGPFAADFGAAVNGIASTPFNVAAGGTDFDVTAPNYASTYWNSTNGPGQASAKSYIPETPWNDSCAQNFTASLTACNSPLLTGLQVVGGGGGQSSCTVAEFSSGTCFAAHPKPAWQSGPYVPSMGITDVFRNMPDVSFFAADGFVSGSFYIVCEADLDPGDAPCSLSAPSNFTTFIGVGGTSSSAPAFAGVMALVNQQETALHASNPAIPIRQGNANYVLYALANAQQKAGLNCNSTTGPDPRCTFNDVTRGNNSVPCYLGKPNCNASSPNPYGLLETTDSSSNVTGTMAFNAGTGYDLATGLGTINVSNLVNNWQLVVGKFTPTKTTLTMCVPPPSSANCTPGSGPIAIMHGGFVNTTITVSPTSGSGTPTGNIAFVFTPSAGTLPQSALGTFTLSGGTVSPALDWLPGGTYTMTAHYAGDGTFGASDSTPISVTVSPENTTRVTLTASVLNLSNGTIAQKLTTPGGGQIDFGDALYLRADISGVANFGKATGTVTFQDTTSTGTAILGPVTINSKGYAELQMGADVFGSPTTSLPVGSHMITASYSGDASYSPTSSTSGLPITVQVAPTTVSVRASATNIPPSNATTVSPNTPVTLTAFIDTRSGSNPSGGSFGSTAKNTEIQGTVTFTVGSTTLPPIAVGIGSTTVDVNGFIAATVNASFTPTPAQSGQLTVTASFAPGTAGNYQSSSTSSAATVNVGSNEGFTITPAVVTPDCSGGSCIIIPAAGKTGTSPVTVTSIGLNGTVALTCAVTPRNPADLQNPGCSFTLNGAANSTVSLTGSGSSGQRMLTITTTAQSVSAAPAIRTQGPDWFLAGAILSLGGCALLLLTVRTRKLKLTPTFALALVIIAGTAVGCGGGNSAAAGGNTGVTSGSGNGGSGGGSMSNPGTTADVYFVTVTATPSAGTVIQTQFIVAVE